MSTTIEATTMGDRIAQAGYKGRRLAEVINEALQAERERAAKIADDAEDQWIENARNVARADDLVGGLAQSTYTNYAEVAGKIARAIREGKPQE